MRDRALPRSATAALLAATLVAACGGGDGDAGTTEASAPPDGRPAALVYVRTEGFEHTSIGPALEAVSGGLGREGWNMIATDSPRDLAESLDRIDVVVFLSTTGDVLDGDAEEALRSWVEGGGGWVGVHAALDTEYEWPWYETLVGARFSRHPEPQEATVVVEDGEHPATAHLPSAWIRTDEWYDTQTNPRGDVHVLATVDEGTYEGGGMGDDHPVVWCRSIGDGESFVTALGHAEDGWDDPDLVAHVVGGITSVAEGACPR